jgi:hypothetical protein
MFFYAGTGNIVHLTFDHNQPINRTDIFLMTNQILFLFEFWSMSQWDIIDKISNICKRYMIIQGQTIYWITYKLLL